MADTLTDPQLASIRADLAGNCDSTSEPVIQAAYDEADGDYCGVRAILWRRVWMNTKTTTLNLVNGGQVISSGNIKAAKERFDYWNDCWDRGTNALQVGSISLGIDVTEDDLDNPLASWLWG